jgi:arylsulfatase A
MNRPLRRRPFVAVLCTFALMLSAAASAAERRPNVVLIMADDFGFECVTANGGQSYQTPHLDRLAATGVRFEHCYVQPLCTPTRVQLMTGIYNVRNYLKFGVLDPAAVTFSQLLKSAGYTTGITGKWQLQLDKTKGLPQHFGFDESFLWQQTRRPPRYANPGLELNSEEIDYTKGEYGPKLISDFALDFITRHRERPFLLYYPMILTHDPFQPTPDSPEWDPTTTGELAKRDVKHFADMVAYMDKMIGRVVAKLEELGLRENTLILFTGDNGTHPTVTSRFKGADYPGGKGTGTVRGNHVPLIASWPAKIPTGRVNADLISSVDFFPTLCDVAGAKLPVALEIDGRSFLPQLLGQRGAHYMPPRPRTHYAQTTTHKLHRDGKFYDLTTDRFEQKPLPLATLTGPAAETAKKLQTVLDRYAQARPKKWQIKAPKIPAKKATRKKPPKRGVRFFRFSLEMRRRRRIPQPPSLLHLLRWPYPSHDHSASLLN